MSVTPNATQVSPNAGGAAAVAGSPSTEWTFLALADATAADPLGVIDTLNASTGAIVSTATAGTFEGSGAQPPTWEWDIATDYGINFVGYTTIQVWATGYDFERTSDTGWGIFLTDAASMSSNNGIGVAHVANGAVDRVSAGTQGGTMGQQNPGITGPTLLGQFAVGLSSTDANIIDDPTGWLLDSNGKRGNGNHAVSSTGKAPTTLKLVLAYQQDATIRAATAPLVSGVPGILFRVIPVPS